jgi:hypothetical protein
LATASLCHKSLGYTKTSSSRCNTNGVMMNKFSNLMLFI